MKHYLITKQTHKNKKEGKLEKVQRWWMTANWTRMFETHTYMQRERDRKKEKGIIRYIVIERESEREIERR